MTNPINLSKLRGALSRNAGHIMSSSTDRFKIYSGRFAAVFLSLLIAPAAIAAPDQVAATYVLLGENGALVARAITESAVCPLLTVDGKNLPMQVRRPAQTVPQRPTLQAVENSKPSAFPVQTCEATLPGGAKHAAIAGRALPLPPAEINRIVVIGDTGCRIKASENAAQDCNDPRKYAFGMVAAKAAGWKPDLVVHVGDYLYRETPCPADKPGCAGSPWGYGWDAWNADFFTPGAPLLRAAPWIVTRGNHENCNRAGQGWWRFLDPRALEPGRDCNDPAQDVTGDYSPPYAVPLGGQSQIIEMDLSIAGSKPIPESDPRYAQFRDAYEKMDALSKQAGFNFTVNHHPILGVAAHEKKGQVELLAGNLAIQSAFGSLNPQMLPKSIDVMLAGHVHLWQQVSFSSDHPSQFIAGFSGTEEDVVPIPANLPPGTAPAPGAVIDHFSSWVKGFGYMTLERRGPKSWDATVWNIDGKIVNRCTITGRQSVCEKAQIPSGE